MSTDIEWRYASHYGGRMYQRRGANKIARATAVSVAASWLFIYVSIAKASQPSIDPDATAVRPAQERSASPAVNDENAPGRGVSELEEVVVTAQRRPEVLSEVPISVQAVTGDQLSLQDVQDSQTLVRIFPELSFTNAASPIQSSFSLRGVTSVANNGGIQPSTAMVVDGVPVANQGEAITNLLDIDHVEVLNGPQGTLFGKNSTAGVINITHNRPTDKTEGWLEVGETTDTETSVRGMVNIPINDWISTRMVGFYDDEQSIIKNFGDGGPSDYSRSWGTSGKVSVNLADNLNALISAGYSHTVSANPFIVILPSAGALGALQQRVTGLQYGYGADAVNNDSPTGDVFNSWDVSAELNWKASEDLKLTSLSSYRGFNDDFISDVDSTPAGVNIGRGYSPNPLDYPIMSIGAGYPRSPDHWNYVSQEVRLNYTRGPVDSILGAYFQDAREFKRAQTALVLDGTYLGLTPTFGTFFYDNSPLAAHDSDTTAALFTDTTYKLTDTLKVFGGLRETRERTTVDYNRHNYFNPVGGFFNPITTINSAPPSSVNAFTAENTVSNLSGRVGLQWQPTHDLNYYVSYNRGYKGPAVNISGTATSAVGDILKPEIATAYEIGAKEMLFNRRLSLNLALFTETIENIQETAVVSAQAITLVNAGNLKTKGIEASFEIVATDHLRFTGGAIYDDAYYEGFNYSCNSSQIPGVGKCGANGIQNLAGQQAIGAPKAKVNVGANYQDHLPWKRFQYYAIANYTWQDSIQYQIDEDPLTREPSHGFLNAAVGVISDDGHWEARLYGNNLANEFSYNDLISTAGIIGRKVGWLPRDYKRYGGLTLKYKF
jgi:iron complex outermembrane recepter protein